MFLTLNSVGMLPGAVFLEIYLVNILCALEKVGLENFQEIWCKVLSKVALFFEKIHRGTVPPNRIFRRAHHMSRPVFFWDTQYIT